MKKIIIFFLIIFCYSNSVASSTLLNEMRALYVEASKNKDVCNKLMKLCNEQSSNTDATILGYKACAKMIMAKFYFNPISKLNSFNNGKQILEAAISKDMSNAELRFLRLTIQNHSPAFLGYNKNRKQDKQFLTNCISSIKEEQLKSIILYYLKNENYNN